MKVAQLLQRRDARHRNACLSSCLHVLLLACVLSGAVAAQSRVPARIVSTSPSITETLFALGLGDRVVGVSSYCWFPPDVATLPKVGTFLKPDVEVIARLRPDLVFVHTGPAATASQLKQIGISTAIVDRGSLASVFSTIRQIGLAAGVTDRAEGLVRTITAAARSRESVGRRPSGDKSRSSSSAGARARSPTSSA